MTAPDIQMVVVPATSARATTEIAKVSFTVPPFWDGAEKERASRVEIAKGRKGLRQIRVNEVFPRVTGA